MNAPKNPQSGKAFESQLASIAEFVKTHNGTRVIDKVLIANNGIAAVKCIRSVRRWAYEMFDDEKLIHFTVMATPEDIKANAEYIKMADHYVPVPGGRNNNNYANVELIVDIAERMGVQAVWAGWGHASENPKLPDSLKKVGIAFIGPPGSAMNALGDKISSTIVAQSADVPTMAWSGSEVSMDISDSLKNKTLVSVSDELYMRACVDDAVVALEAATKIGFPVMIKASEGGGGKGIRMVESAEGFHNHFRQVQGEVPGSPIFIMKLATGCRHLEVQLLADNYGNAISLFGRDCSVQRRHQKIIEEAPVSVAPAECLRSMEKAAVRLAKLVGYVSAGTVEYLYNTESNEFYFLELNPRLQVEHPCTEMISNVNLPAAQLQVAMGIPLHRMQDIRALYGEDIAGSNEIDFENPTVEPKPSGHVIATRITAENPDEGFKPSGGNMQELNFRSSKNVWGYFSVAASGGLHEFADSQFGHIFSYGADRESARKNMIVALKEVSIRGDFRTTVEYLVTLLKTGDFRLNAFSTAWLDKLIADKVKSERPDSMLSIIACAVHIANEEIRERLRMYKRSLERGQILSKDYLLNSVEVDLVYANVKYVMNVSRSGPNMYVLYANNSYIDVEANNLSDGALLMLFNGRSYATYMKEEASSYRVTIDGKTAVFEKEVDPTRITSASPGKLTRYLVEDGEHIEKGQAFAEIEVMKMYMTLQATESGILTHTCREGGVVAPGDLLGTLVLDDPSRVQRPTPFTGKFPEELNCCSRGEKIHQIYKYSYDRLRHILLGYDKPDPLFGDRVNYHISRVMNALKDPLLPLLEMQEVLSAVSGRVPGRLESEILDALHTYQGSINSMFSTFPAGHIANLVDRYGAKFTKKADRDAFYVLVEPVISLLDKYRNGLRGHMKTEIGNLLKMYLDVESQFNIPKTYESIVQKLRELHKDDLDIVVDIVFSHARVARKNQLILKLLDVVCGKDGQSTTDRDKELLKKLAQLTEKETSKVALRARQILIQSSLPSFEKRRLDLEIYLQGAVETIDEECATQLFRLVDQSVTIFDVLVTFFKHQNEAISAAALEVYVRRSYKAYKLRNIKLSKVNNLQVIEWLFELPEAHPSLSASSRKHNGLKKVASLSDDLCLMEDVYPLNERTGVMAHFTSFDELAENFQAMISTFPLSNKEHYGNEPEPGNIVNISIDDVSGGKDDDEQLRLSLEEFVHSVKPLLVASEIRRITFLVVSPKQFPKYFTFRSRLAFNEDDIYRHIEPALAFQLEVFRLSSYKITFCPTDNHTLHLYYGEGKVNQGKPISDRRFFVRAIIRHADLYSSEKSKEYFFAEGERLMIQALDELEVAMTEKQYGRTDCNHIFLHFVPTVGFDPITIRTALRGLIMRHGKRLWKHRVMEAEIRMMIKPSPTEPEYAVRFYIKNESGYFISIDIYKEVSNESTGQIVLKSLDTEPGPLNMYEISTPYLTRDHLQMKRFNAQSSGTTYAYDFPEMFKQALMVAWAGYKQSNPDAVVPENMMNVTELIVDEQGELIESQRLPATNNVGMIAWKFDLFTPECPQGRPLIVICNDITHVIGSFGVEEDVTFKKASEYARKHGVPRLYIAANSGARIGLADEVKQMFKIEWNVPGSPHKGFKYLYVTPEDYKILKATNSIAAELVEENGESRYKITSIFGKRDGLGVENLHGSAAIAGETSLAYEEIMTMTLVSCRTVGIGAYLVRLGQRTIQVEGTHIILTGANALNKVLGREVYASNAQLGGTQIMYYNGVSHLTASNDFEGVQSCLKWLSYVPSTKDAKLPRLDLKDPIERAVEFMPSKNPYDPRHMLAGVVEDGKWISGVFDKGSFTEVLGGWAKTVVTGRARLGGIPVGVIAVETRSVEEHIPADPANLDSETLVLHQAGQVWYPDSAYKTSQSIADFNHEGLPLIIFANWRGFSGGMRDMYEEVLKFGAYIVDELRKYKQPVFIYIPPYGELRGGAWVVVDPAINPSMMEMFADEESRGGVLEPEGTVEIKFRKRDILKVIERTDVECMNILEDLKDTKKTPSEIKTLQDKLRKREEDLLSVYHQVAVQFADLHDTAERMKEKSVIVDAIRWKGCREYLYWRLKRRLGEVELVKKMRKADAAITDDQCQAMIRRWFIESVGTCGVNSWYDNRQVLNWMDEHKQNIKEKIVAIQSSKVLQDITKLSKQDPEVAMDAVSHLVQCLSESHKQQLVDALSKQAS
eukprot:Nk52_evm34s240 gene=Nk52_evmTU34s240